VYRQEEVSKGGRLTCEISQPSLFPGPGHGVVASDSTETSSPEAISAGVSFETSTRSSGSEGPPSLFPGPGHGAGKSMLSTLPFRPSSHENVQLTWDSHPPERTQIVVSTG
jgi:hypothetical protein